MNPRLASRLLLDLTAFSLLLVAFAYYWLDNLVHEVVGTAMFVLLVAHNTLNRHWYKGLPRRQAPRRMVDKVLVLGLLAAMAALLVTSVMSSQSVFAAVASPDAFTARRIHVLAAYWVLLLIGIHLGTRWRAVLGALRRATGVASGRFGVVTLRVSAAVIAAAGVYGSFQIGVGGKLLSRVSLEWWDFAESTLGFFMHHIAIVGLYAYLAYHVFHRIRGVPAR